MSSWVSAAIAEYDVRVNFLPGGNGYGGGHVVVADLAPPGTLTLAFPDRQSGARWLAAGAPRNAGAHIDSAGGTLTISLPKVRIEGMISYDTILKIVADSTVGTGTVNLTIDGRVGYSGDIVLQATGRAGSPATINATITNGVQTDGG